MIRGFSRPVFRVDLVPTFLECLQKLSIPDWVMVRERLYKDADALIDALVEYADASVNREIEEKKWYTLIKTYPLDQETEQLYQRVVRARQIDLDAYQRVCRLCHREPCRFHTEDWNLTQRIMD